MSKKEDLYIMAAQAEAAESAALRLPLTDRHPMSISEEELIAGLKEAVFYDPETGIFTRLKGPKRGKVAGAIRVNDGYISVAVGHRFFLGHRLAWAFTHGKFPDRFIDHINRIRTDNRISNLRASTHGENMQNIIKARKGNSTGLRGVSVNGKNLFVARIQVDKKNRSLGNFKTPEEAHEAYMKAKAILHPAAFLKEVSG